MIGTEDHEMQHHGQSSRDDTYSQEQPSSQHFITEIFNYLNEFKDTSSEVLISRLSLSPQLVRLLRYQLGKQRKNDLDAQPFSWLRPKYRKKPYDLNPSKLVLSEEDDRAPKLSDLVTEFNQQEPDRYESLIAKL